MDNQSKTSIISGPKLPIKINPTFLMTIGVVAILLVVGIGIWYWWGKKAAPTGLGSQLFERAQNPVKDRLPQTNPFVANTNPFIETEINPIIEVTKNPF